MVWRVWKLMGWVIERLCGNRGGTLDQLGPDGQAGDLDSSAWKLVARAKFRLPRLWYQGTIPCEDMSQSSCGQSQVTYKPMVRAAFCGICHVLAWYRHALMNTVWMKWSHSMAAPPSGYQEVSLQTWASSLHHSGWHDAWGSTIRDYFLRGGL